MVQMSKISLRKAYKKIRNNLSDNEVKTLSALINKTLLTQNEYRQASNIGSYYPINNEVIVKNIEGKKYFYPKINKHKLNFFKESDDSLINSFGIKEPVHSKEAQLDKLDLFLVPLIAFNDKLFRIGYGGGFYDTTFSTFTQAKKKPVLIGLGYDCLKSEINFQTKQDIKLDKIITDKGVYV